MPVQVFDGRRPAGSLSTTTVVVSGALPATTPADFLSQLNSWGLAGTFDFFFLPMDPWSGEAAGYAYVNFIDPAFVSVFAWIYRKCRIRSVLGAAEAQGLHECRARWEWCLQSGPCAAWPVILTGQTPSQWAVDAANLLLAPQARAAHFRKTRMCNFFAKKQCRRGAGCSFAHSSSELLPQPSLWKTRLCYAHFAGACHDPSCAFAHGSRELQLEPQSQQQQQQQSALTGGLGVGCAAGRRHKATARSAIRSKMAAKAASGGHCLPLPGVLAMQSARFLGCPDALMAPAAGVAQVMVPQLCPLVPAPWAMPLHGLREDEDSTICETPQRDSSGEDSNSDPSPRRDQEEERDERSARRQGADLKQAGLNFSSPVRVKGTFIDTFSDELPEKPLRRCRSAGDLALEQ